MTKPELVWLPELVLDDELLELELELEDELLELEDELLELLLEESDAPQPLNTKTHSAIHNPCGRYMLPPKA